MTKVKTVEVTCSSCGNKFPALEWYSVSSFIKLTPEKEQKSKEAREKNGVCPKCGTKNEILPNLPKWEDKA